MRWLGYFAAFALPFALTVIAVTLLVLSYLGGIK